MERPHLQAILLLSAVTLLGCPTAMPRPSDSSVRSTISSSLQVPLTVERLAILHPKTYNRELMDAYAQLAGAAFQLKAARPWLRIVERFDLLVIHGEQRFQLSGAVSDETALGVGRLLGADSILLYRIDGPTVRDRLFARMYGAMPPYTVTSKVIRVENAEVVYHNVVTASVPQHSGPDFYFACDYSHPISSSAALNRGLLQTITDLQHAFR